MWHPAASLADRARDSGRSRLAAERRRGISRSPQRAIMRTVFLLTALTVLALPALAQTQPGPVPYASPDDVAAAAARSKAAKSLSAEVLVALPPLRLSVEYRSKPMPASVHEKNNELINVISGSGTLILGGR